MGMAMVIAMVMTAKTTSLRDKVSIEIQEADAHIRRLARGELGPTNIGLGQSLKTPLTIAIVAPAESTLRYAWRRLELAINTRSKRYPLRSEA